jgi:hypothetical protein
VADSSLCERAFMALRLLGLTEGSLRARFQAALTPTWPDVLLIGSKETGGLRLRALSDRLWDGISIEGSLSQMTDEELAATVAEFVDLCQRVIRNYFWEELGSS